MPWDKEVRDDHIKTVAAGGKVAAAIVEHEVHVRAFEHLPIPGRKIRLCRPCHFRYKFNDGGFLHAKGGSGTRRDTGGKPNKRDLAWVGMQQQWQQSLAPLVRRGSAAAQHVGVIKSHLEVIAGFHNRHDAVRPFDEGAQGLTGRAQMDERCPQRMRYHYGQ